ncbi:MAG TPA: hypothetical protein VFM60_07695 [Salinimicrobium sp.]|nr:hypothetical protein [Salinimicrobium sp.]
MAKKYLEILTKIIFFYSLFYMLMKIIAIISQGSWLLPNLILAIPFLIFAVTGGIILKRKSFNWFYVILGAVVISLIRYYESRWVVWLHQYFS